MGIVAAQCRVFIAQNDICAPRPLYYHLFFLDNRRVPACSHSRRLYDSLLLLSISPLSHVLYRLVSSFEPFPEPPGGSSRRRFRPPMAFPHRLSGVSCVVPAGFPLVFSSVSRLSSSSSQSKSRLGGGVPCRTMSRVPCCRSASRSVFLCARRGVSPFEAWGGEGGGEFYGMFHVKRGTSPFIFRCLTSAIRAISQACRAFPCDG